jgi:DNA-binding response OmpR family regulator
MGGLEFLRIVKADDVLVQIPVIVLSNAGTEEDIIESFRLGVAGYMVKPTGYQKLTEAFGIIHKYWTISELPNGD